MKQNEPLPRASAMLVKAREVKGMSLKEVADELFLSTAIIRAIEEGEFDRIQKRAYIRGYLRAYARVVGINGDVVVAAYNELMPVEEPVGEIAESAEPVGSGSVSNLFTGPVFQTGLFALAALILVLLGVWLLTDDAEPTRVTKPPASQGASPDSAKPQRSTVDEAMPLGLEEAPDAEAQDETQFASGAMLDMLAGDSDEAIDLVAGTGLDEDEDALARENADEEAVGQLVRVRTTRERGDQGMVVTTNAGGDDNLQFAFTDECWIEITDANGNPVFGDLLRAGDRLQVFGEAPFEVLFGRAPAVTLAVNGRAFDLAPQIRSDNTAKITVGP